MLKLQEIESQFVRHNKYFYSRLKVFKGEPVQRYTSKISQLMKLCLTEIMMLNFSHHSFKQGCLCVILCVDIIFYVCWFIVCNILYKNNLLIHADK